MAHRLPPSAPGGSEVPPEHRDGAAHAEGTLPLRESEPLSRYRQAVVSYARMCTADRAAADQLAAEGISRGIRQARAEGGNRSLPWLPLLLFSVRCAAADWQRGGDGGLLRPELRQWLAAARESGPPRRRPLVLRAFEDMPEPERALLWDFEVESATGEVADRLTGTGAAAAGAEAARTREVFRGRCLRLHTREAEGKECRGYTKLLDAVTRKPDAARPEDLRRHLAECGECRQAAACLSLRGDALRHALATAVLGWGGPAYADMRRRAAPVPEERRRAHRSSRTAAARLLGSGAARRGWAAAASALTVLAAVVSTALAGPAPGPHRPTAAQVPVRAGGGRPTTPLTMAAASSSSAAPTPAPSTTRQSMRTAARRSAAPGTATPGAQAVLPAVPAVPTPPEARCTVRYHLDDEWPGGFQADITITPRQAGYGWRLAWEFPSGQRITRMWNGTYVQHGRRVVVAPAGYDAGAAPDRSVRLGFLGTWQYGDAAPRAFFFDGAACDSAAG